MEGLLSTGPNPSSCLLLYLLIMNVEKQVLKRFLVLALREGVLFPPGCKAKNKS